MLIVNIGSAPEDTGHWLLDVIMLTPNPWHSPEIEISLLLDLQDHQRGINFF